KAEVSDSSAGSGNVGGIGILMERDHVLTSRSVQKNHVAAESEGFPHAEYLLIKPERALHIPDVQMNVRQASCADPNKNSRTVYDHQANAICKQSCFFPFASVTSASRAAAVAFV